MKVLPFGNKKIYILRTIRSDVCGMPIRVKGLGTPGDLSEEPEVGVVKLVKKFQGVMAAINKFVRVVV